VAPQKRETVYSIELSLSHDIKPRGAGDNPKGPPKASRLFELLVIIGEAFSNPVRRRSAAGHAAVGLLALAIAVACVVCLVVRLFF
jgi:hypothetical protein